MNTDPPTDYVSSIKENTPWHLEKKVPIAIILALAIQTGTIAWWIASWTAVIDARLQNVEVAIPTLQPKALCVEQHFNLEEHIRHVSELHSKQMILFTQRLDRIENKQDRIIELLNGGNK